MTITKKLSSVSVPVTYYHAFNKTTEEVVAFTVFQENEWFKAVPALSVEERLAVGLPEAFVFLYYNCCIADANDMEEETLAIIKKIIQELEVQEMI